jgi:hypothetical protein
MRKYWVQKLADVEYMRPIDAERRGVSETGLCPDYAFGVRL